MRVKKVKLNAKKECKKVFTKKKCNNIIETKYNLSNKDCKIFEREGLPMEKIKNVKKIRKLLEKICEDLNTQNSKETIESFMKKQQ